MNKNAGLLLFVLLILTGIPGCVKEDPQLVSFHNDLSIQYPPIPDQDQDQVQVQDSIFYPVFNPDLIYGSVTDIDSNVYRTIQIGAQTWMAENLKTTRYDDGNAIPNIIDNSLWVTLKTGAYRWYNNNKFAYKNLYGALYNWYTVRTGKLCPVGWHVPSDDEWKQLEMALGMTQEEADSWGEFPGIDGRGTDQATQMKATIG
jgi:uncharacterized protein (TIGR02145 family)